MSSTVRKAVIPAAGLGTRFLPATKAQPKEMLPVIDKPGIQYVVEEAVAAGLDDVLIITGRTKRTVEDHFDRSVELEVFLEQKGKLDDLAAVRSIAELATIHYIRQPEPGGLGQAVGMAADHVGHEPFAVLLPDDLMVDEAALLRSMVEAHVRTECSVLALMEVEPEEISAYGCVAPVDSDVEGLIKVGAMVEKPAPDEAPSNLAVVGRYVLTASVFGAIERLEPGAGGELQLTDAIAELARTEGVYGVRFSEGRYDVGNKIDFLKATVELGLARADLGGEFRAYLRGLDLDGPGTP